MGGFTEKTDINIGLKVRQLRKIRGISLQQLAEDTGMSYSYLSGLENGKHSISINNLQRLAAHFEVSLIHFLDNNHNQTVLIRRGEGSRTQTADGIDFNVITADTAQRLQVSFVEMPANTPTERHIHKHPSGEEFITVTEGEVIVLIEEEKYVLHQGDSVFFQSDREHVIYTESKPGRMILVASPPYGREFEDR